MDTIGISEFKRLSCRWLSQKNYIESVAGLNRIELRVSVNNLNSFEDKVVLDILSFLEEISGQKAVITKTDTRYIGNTKRYFVNFLVTLRSVSMFKFMDYYSVVVASEWSKRLGLVSEARTGVKTLNFNDFSCFFSLNTSLPCNLNVSFYGSKPFLHDLLCLNNLIFYSNKKKV